MISLSLPAFAASAQAAPASSSGFSLSGPRSTEQGDKVVFTANPGKGHKNRTAVLEESTSKGRIPLAVARVKADGTVSFKTTMPLAGHHNLDVRVLKGRATAAASEKLAVEVSPRQLTAAQKKEQAKEAELAALVSAQRAGQSLHTLPKSTAKPSTKPSKASRQGSTPMPPIVQWQQSVGTDPITPEATDNMNNLFTDMTNAGTNSGDSLRHTAEHAAEKTNKMVEGEGEKLFADSLADFGKDLGVHFAEASLDFGIDALLGMIFSGAQEQTLDAVKEMALEMQNDFELVNQQLDAIENDLNVLSQQVAIVSSQVTGANASAAAANCSVLMSQANGYVNQIQGNYNNYQDVLNPTWLAANLSASSDNDAQMRVLGNQVFGSGSGNPSFLQGVNASQQATTRLAHLLTGIGLPPGSSLVDACSSAVSAQLAAGSSTINGYGFVTPAGKVDENYFDTMQALTAYYSSWANLGQYLSTMGSQWVILSLDATPPTSATEASATCSGQQAASSGTGSSALTCAQLGANMNDTADAISQAWDRTGASWSQVTNGMLGADSRVASNSDYIIPARNLWLRDVGLFTTTYSIPASAAVQYGTFTCTSGNGICPPGFTVSKGSNHQAIIDLVTATLGQSLTLNYISGPALPANASATFLNSGIQVNNLPSGVGTYSVSWSAKPFNSDGSLGAQYSATLSFTTNFTDSGTVTGPTANSITYPAAGIPVAGLSLKPATSAQWNNLLQLANQAPYPGSSGVAATECGGDDVSTPGTVVHSCTAPATMGQLITAAGLSNNGSAPNQLIFTGERSQWNATKGPHQYAFTANWDVNNYQNQVDNTGHVGQFIQSWSNPGTFWVNSFIDPALTGNNGFSAVVQDPAGSPDNRTGVLDMNDLYAWSNGSSASVGFSGHGSGEPFMYAPCQSNMSGNANTYLKTNAPGASRLWAQWAAIPTGGAWTVDNNANCGYAMTPGGKWNGVSSDSYGANTNVQVTNTNGEYGTMGVNGSGFGYGLSAVTSVPGFPVGNISVVPDSHNQSYPSVNAAGPGNVTFSPPMSSPLFASSLSSAASAGIMWPTAQLNSSLCPTTGPLAGATSFSNGAANNAGVTNTCEYLWAAYKASALNGATGNLNVNFPDQKTGLPGGPMAALSITNYDSASTTATLYLTAAEKLTLPGSVNVANGSSGAVTGCTNGSISGAADTQCTVTLPPGTSTFTLPVAHEAGASSSSLTAVVSDFANTSAAPTAFAGATATLVNQQVQTGTPPTTPVNLTVVPSATAGKVVASWTAPSANPAVSSYTMSITDPSGNTTQQTINLSDLNVVGNSDGQDGVTASAGVSNSDMQVTTTLTLATTSDGQWTFALTANSSAGSSSAATVKTYLGEGPPTVVQKLAAQERANGTVVVTWSAVQASPQVSGYQVAWQGPDGQWFDPVTVTGTEFTLPQAGSSAPTKALTPGVYTFQVQAKNSAGTGPKASTQVQVIGAAPKAVGSLTASISPTGGISAQWSGADAVPAPSKYSLAIYGPDAAGTAILTKDFPITGTNSTVNIPNFFRIGNDSQEGMYTVVVAGTNDVGLGETAQASLYISQDTINESTLNRVNQQIVGSMPTSFQALAAAQCQAGLWQHGYAVFGSCDPVNLIFTSAPGLPPVMLPTPLPTQGSGAGATALTPSGSWSTGAWSGTGTFGVQSAAWSVSMGTICQNTTTGVQGGSTCPLVNSVVYNNGTFTFSITNRSGIGTSVRMPFSTGALGSTNYLAPGATGPGGTTATTIFGWSGAAPVGDHTASFTVVANGEQVSGTLTLTIS